MLPGLEEPKLDLDPRYRAYEPFGTCKDLFYCKDPEVMFVGPSGTGKSRAILEKMHLMCSKYAGMRALMVRKTRASITQSAMVTFEKFVLPLNDTVHFRTGEQEYRYANGSTVVIGGMDKAIKVMSSEYDFIYAQEATELTEEDWETLTLRNRYGIVPYQQVVGDCNPSFPSHWIKKRIDKSAGMTGIQSRHTDNPMLYDQTNKEMTDFGKMYFNKLNKLTGVRLARFRDGLWAAAEGMIYSNWNPEIHLIDRFPIPHSWQRVWIVDFGYTNPFVWQCWAVDPDGRGYRIAEIYQTRLLVEDAASLILAWRREYDEPLPSAIICDHDAEDRATLERHLNMDTTPASKDVIDGIHSVMSRLRPADDGKPRIMLLRDSLLEVDPLLEDAMKPSCTEHEIEGYEWENAQKKETPRKVDDHGCDDIRYFSKYMDDFSDSWTMGFGEAG